MDAPVTLEPAVRDSIPIPGIMDASHVWIRSLDLDKDGKEDSVVAMASPPEAGPYWRNFRSVTYIFRGKQKGRFRGYSDSEASLWFSVVTRQAQYHVHYGDSEVRRIFCVVRQEDRWLVEIGEFVYGNSGGEDRLMSLKSKDSRRLEISKLGAGPFGFQP